VQSRVEKVALMLAAISVVGSALYWFAYNFRVAGLAAYLPFLVPFIAIAVFWFAREHRFAAQVQLWDTIMEPFPSRTFPAETLDPERHGVGRMEIRDGVTVGAVISLPGDEGIHLQMATGSWRFNDKLIPWEEITSLSFWRTKTLRGFGSVSLGYVAIQFATPRNLKMVIPWRETFQPLVPQSLGFQEAGQISGAAS
jgi:hypothetical protein